MLVSWHEVFDCWMDGSLDRSIKVLMKDLPKESRAKLRGIIG
jgi:hypothetical protein